MGNVRTDLIKRTARELVKRFPGKFSTNFDENKLLVGKLVQGTTPRVRNQIAGYITHYNSGEDSAEAQVEELQEEGNAD